MRPKQPKSTSTAPLPAGGKTTKIFWEKGYAYCTDWFVNWCQDNPTKHVKLFSDSTQDVQEEGCSKVQLNTVKKNAFHELAQYIFENDAELKAEWLARPQMFVTATQYHHIVYVYFLLMKVF